MSLYIEADKTPESKWGIGVKFAFDLFLRLLAVAFFAFSIHTWMSAIGFWEGTNTRFDTMSMTWKVYIALLLVLHPVTCVGLWTTLSWGRVVWFLSIGVQVVAFLRFGIELNGNNWLLLFHAITLVIYVVFQILLFFIAKKA